MKTTGRWFLIGLAFGLASSVISARAGLEVSGSISIQAEADFRAPLVPIGTWVSVGAYGQCWRPASVAVEWRPYCSGHWVWTDCGWYWETDEPWAWACYHYGCWVYDPTYFWIWVPGVQWAPAWVSWRVGGGYIGWAPLAPPGIRVTVSGPQFVFVESGRFTEPIQPSKVVVNNTTIINQTRVINNLRQETRTVAGSTPQKVFVNEGPGVETVQKATGKHLAARPVRELVRNAPVPSPRPATTVDSKKPAPTAPMERPDAPRSHDLKPREGQAHGLSAPRHEQAKPERPKEHLAPPANGHPGVPPQPGKPPKPPKEPGEGKGYGSESDPKANGHESQGHGKDKL